MNVQSTNGGDTKIKRVFLIVLDSCGIGEMPDASRFNDDGSDTFKTISQSEKFHAPNMTRLGIFNIDGMNYHEDFPSPAAAYGRFAESSDGKDTTTGHWEIAGLISEKPFPTYPDGFPDEIIEKFKEISGRGVICNRPYSGTRVIADYGDEHVKTGDLIVYTSADSVFQIAAHEDIVPLSELYSICEMTRKMLTPYGVGRVIARPFTGDSGSYTRTSNRRDFSMTPPENTLLDDLKSAGLDVISVGKIADIFAGQGITEGIHTVSNADGMEKTDALLQRDFTGLCFTNLVDFDMLYGHRNDIDGYASALTEFDAWLANFLPKMNDDDILMLTADHGCDPATASTDHSREYVFLLACGRRIKPVNLGTHKTFADIGRTIADIFGIETEISGSSFKGEIL